MTLRELLTVVRAGSVQIYEADPDSETGFRDICVDRPDKITGEVLDREVIVVGAARKYVIDVQVAAS